MQKSYSIDLAGRTLTLETGEMAGLANGSVLVKYGDTTVLVNATASKEPKDGIDFFPLSVEYNENQSTKFHSYEAVFFFCSLFNWLK